jgi:hypothetical protein
VWAELPGQGWLPAVVLRVGRDRGEITTITLTFEGGRTSGARTPPYLRKRDLLKRGKDRPPPVRRDDF